LAASREEEEEEEDDEGKKEEGPSQGLKGIKASPDGEKRDLEETYLGGRASNLQRMGRPSSLKPLNLEMASAAASTSGKATMP